jgi:hypothetical protein
MRAHQKCTELNRFIEAMRKEYFFLGEQILIPFSGAKKSVVENDAYNYHLSQLRIRIEQA